MDINEAESVCPSMVFYYNAGNTLFKEGNYELAIEKYTMGLSNSFITSFHEQEEFTLKMLLNRSQAYILIREYEVSLKCFFIISAIVFYFLLNFLFLLWSGRIQRLF
jgi:hypothetical protein